MNRGTFRGNPAGIGDYQGLPPGGSWNGNRGRQHWDEIRMWGFADGIRNWQAAGSGRVINTNPQALLSGLTEAVYPGDSGMVLNILTGTIMLNNTGFPFASMVNCAGRIRHSTSPSISAAIAFLENNTIVDNVNGIAVSNMLQLSGITSTTTYLANGASCTVTGGSDIASGPAFTTSNSGTLTATSYVNFSAACTINTGATVTSRSMFFGGDAGGSGGAITNQYGLDLPILISASTINTPIRIGRGGQTFSTNPAGNGLIDLYTGTTIYNISSGSTPSAINIGGTFQFTQSGSGLTFSNFVNFHPTFTNTVGDSTSFGLVQVYQCAPTININTQTAVAMGTFTGFNFAPTVTASNSGTYTSGTIVGLQSGVTTPASSTITSVQHILLNSGTFSGTLTTQVGADIHNMMPSGVTTGIGIRLAGQVNPLQLSTVSTGPTTANLTSNTNAVFTIYFGGTNYYFLIAWNDGGTVRYKYLPLTGTTATWATGTTLPT